MSTKCENAECLKLEEALQEALSHGSEQEVRAVKAKRERDEAKRELRHEQTERKKHSAKVSEIDTLREQLMQLRDALAAARIREGVLREAAQALIADVRRRHPGEELTCPLMQALDAALSSPPDAPDVVGAIRDCWKRRDGQDGEWWDEMSEALRAAGILGE